MEKGQVIHIRTSDESVNITLESWAELLIERAMEKHRLQCPVTDMDKRINALELKLKIVHWLTAPFYLGTVAWTVNFLIQHFKTI